MKRNLNALTFMFALALAACSGSNNQRHDVPTGPNTAGYNAQGNNIVTVGNMQCNLQDRNPQSPASPINTVGSPCTQLNNVQQANPAFANQPVIQQSQYANPNAPTPNFQQGVNGANGVQALQNPALYQTTPLSSDINPHTGRIVNKIYRLARGSAAKEVVNDSCHLDKNYSEDLSATTAVPDSRFYHSIIGDRFDLDFGPDGSLQITAQSLIGQVISQRNVPYYLDDTTQSLVIGGSGVDQVQGVQMLGNPSHRYIAWELTGENKIEMFRNQKTKDAYDIKEALPSSLSSGSSFGGGSGFTLDHGGSFSAQQPIQQVASSQQTPQGQVLLPGQAQAAQSGNQPVVQQSAIQPGAIQPGSQPQQQARVVQASQTTTPDVGTVFLEFPEGINLHVTTSQANPYHIEKLAGGASANGDVSPEGIPFHSATDVTLRGHPLPCHAEGTGSMVLLFNPN